MWKESGVSRLEEWQLDMLEYSADMAQKYELKTHINIEIAWLRPLLEEIRASRASAGGGAEPLKKAYEELRRLSQAQYMDFEKGFIKDQSTHLAASHAYDNAVKVLEECFGGAE